MQIQSKTVLTARLILCCATTLVAVSQEVQPTAVIIENARIFDGTADRLSAPSNVLVVGT